LFLINSKCNVPHGEAADIVRMHSAGLFILDPPYFAMMRHLTTWAHDESLDFDQYMLNLENCMTAVAQIANTEDYSLIQFHGARETGHVMNLLQNTTTGFRLPSVTPCFWTKPNIVDTGNRIICNHEQFQVGHKDGGEKWLNFPKQCVYRSTTWTCPTNKHKMKDLDRKVINPCEKPIPLYLAFLETFSRPGEYVVSAFDGVGTSHIAGMLHGRSIISIEKDPLQIAAVHTRIAQWKHQMESPDMTKEVYDYLKLTCTAVSLKGPEYMRQLWNDELLGPFDYHAAEMTSLASIEKEETDLLSQSLRVRQVDRESDEVVSVEAQPVRAPIRMDGIVKAPLSLTALFMEYTNEQEDDPLKLTLLTTMTTSLQNINNVQYDENGEVLMCHKHGTEEASQCFTQKRGRKEEKRGNAVGMCIGCHLLCCSVHALVPVGFLGCQDGAFIQCQPLCLPALVMRALYQPLISPQDQKNIKFGMSEAIEAVHEWMKYRNTPEGSLKRYSSWIRDDKGLGGWRIRKGGNSAYPLPGYPPSFLVPPPPEVIAKDFIKEVGSWVASDEQHKVDYLRCMKESMIMCLDPLELPETKEARDTFFGAQGAEAGERKESALVSLKKAPEYFGGSAMMDAAVRLIGAPTKERDFTRVRNILGPDPNEHVDLTVKKKIAVQRQSCE